MSKMPEAVLPPESPREKRKREKRSQKQGKKQRRSLNVYRYTDQQAARSRWGDLLDSARRVYTGSEVRVILETSIVIWPDRTQSQSPNRKPTDWFHNEDAARARYGIRLNAGIWAIVGGEHCVELSDVVVLWPVQTLQPPQSKTHQYLRFDSREEAKKYFPHLDEYYPSASEILPDGVFEMVTMRNVTAMWPFAAAKPIGGSEE